MLRQFLFRLLRLRKTVSYTWEQLPPLLTETSAHARAMDGSNLYFPLYTFNQLGHSSHSSNAESYHELPNLNEAPNFAQNWCYERIRKPCWTLKEDDQLREPVKKYGTKLWGRIARETTLSGQTSTLRNGKSCRSRWMDQLSPDVQKDPFTWDEEKVILDKQREIGNNWAQIAGSLPGRTDNAVKNHWNRPLKRKTRTLALERGCPGPENREAFRPVPTTAMEQSFVPPNPQYLVESALPQPHFPQPPNNRNAVVQGIPANVFGNCCDFAAPPPYQEPCLIPGNGCPVASEAATVGECLDLLSDCASPFGGLVAVTTGAITQALAEGWGWDAVTSAKVGAVVGSLTLQGLFQPCVQPDEHSCGRVVCAPTGDRQTVGATRKRFRES